MQSQGETYWPEGKKRIPITEKYILSIVDQTYDASFLNPGWGNPKGVTKKLLTGIYTQSRFFQWALNTTLNKDKTSDIGIAQVNSKHFKNGVGLWYVFCKEQGLTNTDPKELWDIGINIRFMAWYNQRAIDRDMDTYHFNRTKDQKQLYSKLLKVIDDDAPLYLAENK